MVTKEDAPGIVNAIGLIMFAVGFSSQIIIHGLGYFGILSVSLSEPLGYIVMLALCPLGVLLILVAYKTDETRFY